MTVFNDLKTRGVHDVLVAVTNGLKGMPEALGSVFATTSRRPASFTSPTTAWNMRVGRLVLSWLPRSGRELNTDIGSLTRMLSRMEKRGLIERVRSESEIGRAHV